jgi:Flp pilus assembly protein TadG
MASRLRRLLRRDDGQALTELGLTAGFLCLMLLAVWQVGTVFSNYIDLSEAARQGARAAALSGAPSATGDTASFTAATNEGTAAAVCSVNAPPCTLPSSGLPGMNVVITSDTPWSAGAKVRVTVSAPYSLSLFGIINVASGIMSVSDVMRVHRQGA